MTAVSIANLSHTRCDELLYGVIIALLLDKYRHLPLRQLQIVANASAGHPSALIDMLRNPRLRAVPKTLLGLAFCALLALLPCVLNTDILGYSSNQFFFSSAAFCG